jgi:hypothetical protein
MSGTFEFWKIQLKIYDVVHEIKKQDQTLSFKSDVYKLHLHVYRHSTKQRRVTAAVT